LIKAWLRTPRAASRWALPHISSLTIKVITFAAASKGIMTLGVTLCVCPPRHARRISLGGEGNASACWDKDELSQKVKGQVRRAEAYRAGR